ncbi:MAG: hypothetical protein PF495_16720 [Spirochaetales bacterium]|jgi:hypothetical protein|nr:hypothetical protein [Spirochaetales bacterium]
MEKVICSYCGKETVSIEEHEIELTEPYGGASTVKIKEKVCTYCGFEEEDDSNDLVIQKELSVLKRVSMVKVLDALNAMGHTNASMERALGLPARTLARWKNEQTMSPSASGIALMRIIRTYPWILDVADMQFDHKSARNMLLQNAANELMKMHCEHPEYEVTSSAQIADNYFEFFIKGSRTFSSKAISGGNNVFTSLR